MINRRTFAQVVAGAAMTPALAKAAPRDTISRRPLLINALGELADPNTPDLDAGVAVTKRVLDDALASGVTAINITLGDVAGADEPFEATVRDIVMWDGIVRAHPKILSKVLTVADIERARKSGKIGLIYGFQNSTMMGARADRVDLFADMGVRVIQLTYNKQNQLGGGSMAAGDLPLTAFGHEVLERLNARRVIVDLSHSGERTCLDAARATKAPIAITHTGCRAITDLPRNKTDAEMRLVAQRGGFVGIYFMPFLNDGRQITGDDVCTHIEHAIKICGEDHVGIGTDGGTTRIDDMAAWKKAFVAQLESRRARGVSAPGERPDSFIFAIDMNGPDQFRILARKLAARGHPQRVIDKVLGANFARFAGDVWGV